MKEFTSQTGGRFTYVDDFLNLQELALAFGEIFTDCDNFIVSGCEVSGNSISAGLVYLNGKLRVVEETPSITGGWPQYIYEVNDNKNVPYASGVEKIGREVWGTKVGKTVPTTATALTGEAPKAIQINSTGGLRMKDAWFGKYALLLNPAAPSQSVKGTVNLQTLNVTGMINSQTQYILRSSGCVGNMYFSGANLIFEGLLSGPAGTKRHQMVFDYSTNSIKFIVDGIAVATLKDSDITFAKPLTLGQVNIGKVCLTDSHIYNASAAEHGSEVNINMLSYGGGTNYFRNTNIGDGKGNAILSISGKKKTLVANGQLIVGNYQPASIILRSILPKSNSSLTQHVSWQDVNQAVIATFGFNDPNNKNFGLSNHIGDVVVTGANTVDLGPAIKENGVLLSEKYALQSNINKELSKKANALDVYSKDETYSTQQCNDKFATKAGGLAQFIVGSNSDVALCKQIGAIREDDLKDYVQKSKLLADIATTDAAKATIRKNIGAAAADDLQKDSGWVPMATFPNLYIRQIGNIVCIQGLITTVHDGTVFEIPNNIDPPRYAIGYDAAMTDEGYWSCRIKGGTKKCEVLRCAGCDKTIPISITYMT